MSTNSEDVRTVLQAEAREHGVKLSLDAGVRPPKEAVLDAVHHALHGVALAQVDAEELVVKVGPQHDHEVDVEAQLKD